MILYFSFDILKEIDLDGFNHFRTNLTNVVIVTNHSRHLVTTLKNFFSFVHDDLKYQTWQNKLVRDQHSSLLFIFIGDVDKKNNTFAFGVNVRQLFSLSPMTWNIRLVWISLSGNYTHYPTFSSVSDEEKKVS
jgi:hypothetical protein